MREILSPERERRFWEGVERSGRFLMGDSPVHGAMLEISRALSAAGIPHAVVGAMALNEHGYHRVTVDVDILLSREGLERFKQLHLGRGYVEKFPGSKRVRDTKHGVNIDFLLAGDYPGDGKPKAVRFPDPAVAAVAGARVSLLPLERILELKLASGMSAPHRLKDLADVLEVIKALALDQAVGDRLDASVRGKFHELWQAAQMKDPLSDE